MSDVTVTVSGSGNQRGIEVFNASPTLLNVTVTASGDNLVNGILCLGAAPMIRNSTVTASSTVFPVAAVANDTSTCTLVNCALRAESATGSSGILNSASSGTFLVEVINSTIGALSHTVSSDTEFTTRLNNCQLSGGSIAANGGLVTCAGCFDENYDALVASDTSVGTDASFSISGIDRSSAVTQTFNIQNSGSGTMQLLVDNSPVHTFATDGTGSGVNADFLDGLDGTAFGRHSTVTNSWTMANTWTDASTFSNTVNIPGLLTASRTPSGTGVGDGSVYVHPSSAVADRTLIGAAVAGVSKFRFDADGDMTVEGSLEIGNGTPITDILSATGTVSIGVTAAQASADDTIALSGAAVGDVVLLGVPSASVISGTCWTAWVSAPDTITVRFNNYDSSSHGPANSTFRVTVIKF
jgi:hypothetical protein